MSDAGRLAALGTNQHDVGGIDGAFLLDAAALLERQRMDLNAVRQEVTEYILDLQALLAVK